MNATDMLLDPVRLLSLVLLAGWLGWRWYRARRVRRQVTARLWRVTPSWSEERSAKSEEARP